MLSYTFQGRSPSFETCSNTGRQHAQRVGPNARNVRLQSSITEQSKRDEEQTARMQSRITEQSKRDKEQTARMQSMRGVASPHCNFFTWKVLPKSILQSATIIFCYKFVLKKNQEEERKKEISCFLLFVWKWPVLKITETNVNYLQSRFRRFLIHRYEKRVLSFDFIKVNIRTAAGVFIPSNKMWNTNLKYKNSESTTFQCIKKLK